MMLFTAKGLGRCRSVGKGMAVSVDEDTCNYTEGNNIKLKIMLYVNCKG